MTTNLAAPQVIGIDLGGTAIKLGRFDQAGQCLQSLTVPTPQPPQPAVVLDAIVAAIAQLDPQNHCRAIGLGTPGPADAAGRVARVAINLGWKDVPLADWLEAKTGKPTVLANDANCAGLGEAWLGAGRQFHDLILLTLGTGVGGAVVMNGKLFVGRHGTAGELGLITLDLQGNPCNSGNRGSLEQHVSVQAIRRRTGLEPEQLGQLAAAGNEEAIAFWHTYGCELAAGLASLIYILTPAAVIIGGGISASFEWFYPSLLSELEIRVLASSREGLQILPAELGNQAGIVGAAKLAWELVDGLTLDCSAAGEAQGLGADELTGLALPSPTPESLAEFLAAELQRVRLAYQMATEMAQYKAGFLARASHEVRSPLNGVIGLQQLILSDLCDSPEEEREFVKQSNQSALKMLALLDEVIAISKAEHGTSKLEIQPLQLLEVLEVVQQMTQMPAQNRNLRLQIDRPDPSIYVLADPRCLKQLLVSLVGTAIAQMNDGSIHLSTHLDLATKQVHLWLEDTRPIEAWQEPVHLLSQPDQTLSFTTALVSKAAAKRYQAADRLSPGLSLLASQALLDLMGGQLKLLAIAANSVSAAPGAVGAYPEPAKLSRLQCSLPLAQDD